MALGELERFREVTLLSSEGIYYHLTSIAGKKAAWAPGYQPVIVKAFTAQHLTSFAYTACSVIGFYKNSSPGLTATGNFSLIDTITLTTGAGSDVGQVFFSSPVMAQGTTSQVILFPGEELVVQLTGSTSTASESHAFRATFFYEPWEQNPGDNANMTAA